MGTDTKKKYINLDLKSLGMIVALVVIFTYLQAEQTPPLPILTT